MEGIVTLGARYRKISMRSVLNRSIFYITISALLGGCAPVDKRSYTTRMQDETALIAAQRFSPPGPVIPEYLSRSSTPGVRDKDRG